MAASQIITADKIMFHVGNEGDAQLVQLGPLDFEKK